MREFKHFIQFAKQIACLNGGNNICPFVVVVILFRLRPKYNVEKTIFSKSPKLYLVWSDGTAVSLHLSRPSPDMSSWTRHFLSELSLLGSWRGSSTGGRRLLLTKMDAFLRRLLGLAKVFGASADDIFCVVVYYFCLSCWTFLQQLVAILLAGSYYHTYSCARRHLTI